MKRAFEGGQGGGDGPVGVRAGGRNHPAGESRVVAAAVLGVEHEAHVQKLRFFLGKQLVGAHDPQNAFGGGVAVVGVMDVQAALVVEMALGLIGVS